jgi:hypothetical protein
MRREGKVFMKLSYPRWHSQTSSLLILISALTACAGCAPVEPVRPTLDEARLGNVRGPNVEDSGVRPGETAGEVTEVNRSRQEIYLLADNGQRQTVPFDYNRTRVTYHGRDYTIDNLEAGDRVAYLALARGRSYVDIIRIQEPVQARSGSGLARSNPPRPKTDILEGTVDRVDPNLGVFDLTPRSGRRVTVSVPYNARQTDVESFRSLRRGDLVRIEGEFVSPDNLHLLSFLSPRER